jgi:CO dehydrogenase/acetyl-CoA synthase epsilon subunit
MKIKLNHLVQLFKEVKFESIDGQDINSKALECQLCNFKANSILDMVKHNKSLRHIQIEQIYCLQRRCESLESIDIGDVYKLVDGELKREKVLMSRKVFPSKFLNFK